MVIIMKNYAVIGTGHFGEELARAIKNSANCELVLVHSPSQTSENLAKEMIEICKKDGVILMVVTLCTFLMVL